MIKCIVLENIHLIMNVMVSRSIVVNDYKTGALQ